MCSISALTLCIWVLFTCLYLSNETSTRRWYVSLSVFHYLLYTTLKATYDTVVYAMFSRSDVYLVQHSMGPRGLSVQGRWWRVAISGRWNTRTTWLTWTLPPVIHQYISPTLSPENNKQNQTIINMLFEPYTLTVSNGVSRRFRPRIVSCHSIEFLWFLLNSLQWHCFGERVSSIITSLLSRVNSSTVISQEIIDKILTKIQPSK